MTSDLHRWQAAMGSIAGALVADATASGTSEWTEDGLRSIDIAEDGLRGTPTPIDLAPQDASVAAIGLAGHPAPLLTNPATVELLDAVRRCLTDGAPIEVTDPDLAHALAKARGGPFLHAISTAVDPAEARLIGALGGLEAGLGWIPARLVSTIGAADGRRGRRYLCGLTNRLLGLERPLWYDPRNRRGPREVLPGVWLANLFGLSSFTANHPDGLVLSLCDDEGRVANHAHHVTFHLEDTPRAHANPSLATVVDDVLAEIDAARSTDQPVLVHCRHGASRTGLILRVLLVRDLGLSADDAMTEALCLWPHTSSWNTEWTREVERRATHQAEPPPHHP